MSQSLHTSKTMTSTHLNPTTVAARVIALHGGREAYLAHSSAQIDELNTKWNQNAALMGLILRSHLFVEYYLENYLLSRNPNIGSLENARLTFAQKAELMGVGDDRISYLVPGIRRLNKIRNRLAHTLSASVTEDDRDTFLAIGLFRSLREALAAPKSPSLAPIDVLEAFAQHAGMALQAASDPSAGYWITAMSSEQQD
ncbi:hypothetical protein [Stenotrophomonas humi]|uniref:hypothetical protein n=1 Tax=Stenotrophomonas humi TaxID=405444 RepID=UPI00128F6914|nr:hypothetical protein [Stenotrophomonas humi]